MKRLIIIVEGDSELEFVKKTLIPYLNTKFIFNISAFKIKHSKGGLNKFTHLQTDILNVLYETNVIVTTIINYYGLPFDFPNYKDAEVISNLNDKITFLEDSILKIIETKQNHKITNLIPYIQLHEFEALCFSGFNGFEQNFTESEADYKGLKALINSVKSPEEINNGKDTAPSIRLKRLVTGYNKVVYGNMIIERNGIESILEKCPRFKYWIDKVLLSLQD